MECSFGHMKLHVEVPLFLCFFCFMVSISVTQNLIIYRTCYLLLDFNETECALLGSTHPDNYTARLEQRVEPNASVILMTLNVVESLIAPFFAFILGPWSDKYGRRPIMLSSLIGFTLSSMVTLIISIFPHISPWFLVIKCIPVILSGGFCAYFTATLSYISDVTSEESRGLRMSIFEGILLIGATLGTLFGPFIFFSTNYWTVYVINVVCLMLATAFSYFCIPESILNPATEGGFRALFDFSLVTDAFGTTFRKRESHNRCILFITITLLLLFSIIFNTDGVIFLYFRDKFQWSLEKYSIYSSASGLLWFIGLVLSSFVLHKLLHVSEIPIIFMSVLFLIGSFLIQALANNDWEIYLATCVRMWAASISPLSRSLMTKVISPDENGKVFCVVTSLEEMVKMLTGPLYTFIYNVSLINYPGAFNFLSAGFMVFGAVLIMIMYPMYQKQRRTQYETLDDQTTSIND